MLYCQVLLVSRDKFGDCREFIYEVREVLSVWDLVTRSEDLREDLVYELRR